MMHTGLSPEWDRGFDEAFTDLVSDDDDLVRAEFTSLIQATGLVQPPARPPGDPCDEPHGPDA
ncbi:hypothetical protein [Dactylosporangium sp. NPDC000521]|uniref:hypothetical protein n=1 Tax=Dactylosporangium sp. NPDC000521 TaxID=3363975 RepID=UPI0036B5036F